MHPKAVHLVTPGGLDAVACQLVCNLGTLTIVSVYIHPDASVSPAALETFLCNIPRPCVVGGDWNAKHSTWGDHRNDARGEALEAAVDAAQMVVLNNGNYTRVDARRSASAIDVTLASADISLLFEWETLDHPYGSDHLPISFGTTSIYSNVTLPAINYKKLDWAVYEDLVEEAVSRNRNPTYEEFYETVKTSLERACPPPRPLRTTKKVPLPFWDDDLNEAKSECRQKFSVWRLSLDYEAYQDYAAAEKRFKDLVKSKRTQSWRSKCDTLDSQTSANDLFVLAKRYKGRATGRQQALRDERILEEVLDRLAPPSTKPPPPPEVVCDCGKHDGQQYFSIHDLQTVLKQGKDTAPGADDVNYSAIRKLPFNAQVTLVQIYNQIYEAGVIPESWKVFKIIPILKPEKPADDSKSYRPIALASCFRKTYESMIKEKLEWYLEHNNILPDTICGFRKGKGTMDALHLLVEEVHTAFSRNEHVAMCSIDIQSAYDNVQIPILLQEFREIGVEACLIKALHGLFGERILSASLDNVTILVRVTWMGLPQGSPLSPLCFNVVVRKPMEPTPASAIKIDFADDMTVAVRGVQVEDSVSTLQAALDEVVHMLKELGLEVSPPKCAAMVFSKRCLSDVPELYINGATVEYKDCITLLGINLTPSLSWASQIRRVKRRTSVYVNFMRSVAAQRWGSHPSAMLAIYKACVRSIIDYGSIFFGEAPERELIQLDRIQWNCLRIALGSTKTTHTGSLETMSGVMPLGLRRQTLLAKFVNRRFSLEQWHQRHVAPVLEGELPPSFIRKMIIQFRVYAGLLTTVNNLPCFLYPASSRQQIISIDFSVQTAIQGQPVSRIPRIVEDIISQKYSSSIVFATDGSKDEDHCGYAVVDGNLQIVKQIKLPNTASIFLAEGLAIRQAVYHIAQHPGREFLILSDSLSNLNSLNNRRLQGTTPIPWFDIRNRIIQLEQQGKTVSLMWVPAHRNVALNEAADAAAKLACIEGDPETYQLNSLDISYPGRAKAMQQWQSDWNNGNKGRFCHGIVQSVQTTPWFHGTNLPRREIVILSKFISNHSRIATHLKRNNIIDDDTCECGVGVASPNHLLFTCDLYEDFRGELWRRLIRAGIAPDLEKILKSKNLELYKCLAKFIMISNIDM